MANLETEIVEAQKEKDPSDKTVVITGGNRGIGRGFAESYLKLGYLVFCICRKESPELVKLGCRVVVCDVTSDADIELLGIELQGQKIDLLINNAGLGHC
jgi:NAD(P)-dependent dehydrogenase (short-subunit alcohol dehydrogenase family)